MRDRIDPYSPDPVCTQEVGLLDCMAVCECSQPDPLPEGRTGLHAGCQLSVPDKRHLVIVHMVQTL